MMRKFLSSGLSGSHKGITPKPVEVVEKDGVQQRRLLDIESRPDDRLETQLNCHVPYW